MQVIRPGETWKISLTDEFFIAKVIEASDTSGWWKCVDIATGAEVSIPERWFIERLDEGEDAPPE